MNKQRIEELVSVFCDADKRAKLTAAELEKCPTIEEAMGLLA